MGEAGRSASVASGGSARGGVGALLLVPPITVSPVSSFFSAGGDGVLGGLVFSSTWRVTSATVLGGEAGFEFLSCRCDSCSPSDGLSSSCSSSGRTSFQEHLACFLVHPIQAVRFFRQSMCRRRHRSQGGRTRSPRCIDSILLTISDLKGPPSSRSRKGLLTCGISDAGVPGMATVAVFLLRELPDK